MIRFYNVSKVYATGVHALLDVSFSIAKGEFVFLVGPSGAGKTTILKLIFREEEPSQGQILFNGRSLVRIRNKELPFLRRKFGMIFQDFRLLPGKTVYENVAFALEIIGAPKKQIEKAVPAVLTTVGLSEKFDAFPDELSGGEQQRTCIARAIVNNPILVVADEPTGNLDPETSWELMNLLVEINKRGTTIIMATHAREIVDAMHKRVLALDKGRLVRDEERGTYDYGT
ncbi:MAG TPA: cell division ATP-binding protein FtsE [Clostridia bacterium]|nr:cell division ATP-binding protein FtsE [Clostridia bacterium]